MGERNRATSIFISGALAGGTMAWLMDARQGRRRRMLLKDAAVHAGHVLKKAADKTSRDVTNRAKGGLAAGRSLFQKDHAPDTVLEQRVRSRLGRLVSHPDAIDVRCRYGEATLSGPILADEAARLVAGVRGVRGVRAVENRLEVHQEPGNHPDLQPGNRPPTGPRAELLQDCWSPATRLAAGAAGIALALLGRRNRIWGFPLRTTGGAIFLRACCNRGYRRALGLDREDRGIEIQKTTHIDAPVERVYGFWSRPENFALIMSHVKEVQNSNGSYRWTVTGPGGLSVSWSSRMTQAIPNRLIAWESEPGSPLRNCGSVRFEPANGGTRVHVRMLYNPVGGMLSHSLAALLGADPKTALDEDMVRMKSLFEIGKTTAHRHAVRREQVMNS
jgi:uncharacterized membrane protein